VEEGPPREIRKGDDMANSYFMITASDDGDVRADGPISASKLKSELEQLSEDTGKALSFAERAPPELSMLGSLVLVIKGEIVRPEPVEVATSYKIP
jgi:hypothetical protein